MTILLAGFLATVPSQAQADTPQPGGPPDGGKHSWCYLSGFGQKSAADAAMTRLRNQTDVQTTYPGSCRTHTDVRWRQGSVSGAYGNAVCRTRRNGNCDTYNITLNMAVINNAARPVDQRTKTSGHELGHTAGVRHYFNNDRPGNDTHHSCMRSGEVRAWWRDRIYYYGNHHRGHINGTF